jgi:hypothetical protein
MVQKNSGRNTGKGGRKKKDQGGGGQMGLLPVE